MLRKSFTPVHQSKQGKELLGKVVEQMGQFISNMADQSNLDPVDVGFFHDRLIEPEVPLPPLTFQFLVPFLFPVFLLLALRLFFLLLRHNLVALENIEALVLFFLLFVFLLPLSPALFFFSFLFVLSFVFRLFFFFAFTFLLFLFIFIFAFFFAFLFLFLFIFIFLFIFLSVLILLLFVFLFPFLLFLLLLVILLVLVILFLPLFSFFFVFFSPFFHLFHERTHISVSLHHLFDLDSHLDQCSQTSQPEQHVEPPVP